MGTLRPVDLAWLDAAPVRATTERRLRHPPEAVFDAIAGDPAGWGHWFPGFSDAGRYLDDPPHGAGSVREVHVAGVTATERVLAWDRPGRWAFCAERFSVPGPAALAEDYRLAPTGEGSTLTWTMALDPGRIPRSAFAPLPTVLTWLMRRFCAHLDAHLDRSRPSANGTGA